MAGVDDDVTVVDTPASPISTRHLTLALLALALGGFAIGTTEFMTMGLLEDISHGIHESIPRTGHLITAYAFGVVVGAPIIVSLGARLPKRELAIGLILALGVGNAITAVASGYWPLVVARFVAGLPHGAYFGVASLLAASLVRPEYKGRAVSSVILGLSVATVAGVPASTVLGQHVGWRSAYWLVLAIAVLAAISIFAFVPHSVANHGASMRGELAAFKRPQVLFAISAGMIGFGGMFAMYSYISPIVTKVADLSSNWIAVFLLAFGLGSVAGSWAAGVLADWNVERSVLGGFAATVLVLIAFYFVAGSTVPALILVFGVGALGSIVAINLQMRLMHEAGDAQMLGAAINHSSLNLANGLGAYFGGVVIAGGHGYRATSLVGVVLAAAGMLIFAVGLAVQKRITASQAMVG